MLAPPPSDAHVVDVALNFQGRRKLVRHLSSTRVGEIVDLHPALMEVFSRPHVLVDRDGFEMGRELPLFKLLNGSTASGATRDQGNPPLLELEFQPDEWA